MYRLTQDQINRLRAVQDNIRKFRDGTSDTVFDMRTWLDGQLLRTDYEKDDPLLPYIPEGFCGTAGCIAGHLALNDGWKPAYSSGTMMVKNGNRDMVHRIAEELLYTDISVEGEDEEDSELDSHSVIDDLFTGFSFDANDTSIPATSVWHGLAASKPDDAIEAIERFINKYKGD